MCYILAISLVPVGDHKAIALCLVLSTLQLITRSDTEDIDCRLSGFSRKHS